MKWIFFFTISCVVFLCLLPGNGRINLCVCGVYHQSGLQALRADEKQQSWVLISTAARTAEGWEKPSLIFVLWGWIMHLPVEKGLEVTATWRPASEHFLPRTKPITAMAMYRTVRPWRSRMAWRTRSSYFTWTVSASNIHIYISEMSSACILILSKKVILW